MIKFFTLILLNIGCSLISNGQSNKDYWTIYNVNNSSIVSNHILRITPSVIDSNRLILSCKLGISFFDKSENLLVSISPPDIPNKPVVGAAEISDSTLFFGFLDEGLGRYKNGEWTFFNSKNTGLRIDTISDLFIKNDTVYFSEIHNGVYSFIDSSFRYLSKNIVSKDSKTTFKLTSDSSGNIWTSALGEIGKFNGEWTFIKPWKDTFLFDYIMRGISYDLENQSIWVAAPVYEGFLQIKNQKVKKFNNPKLDVYSDITFSFHIGPFGHLWIATQDGVIIFDPKSETVLSNFTTFDSPLPVGPVRTISIDEKNSVAYFGTWGGGLAKWEYGKDPEFMAVMSAPEVKSPTPLLISQNANQLIIQNLAPQSIISIFNLQGQLLIREKSNNQTAKTISPNFPSGIYLFKTSSPTGSTSQKFLFTKI